MCLAVETLKQFMRKKKDSLFESCNKERFKMIVKTEAPESAKTPSKQKRQN